MRNSLLTINLLILLGGYSAAVLAIEPAIKVTSIAEVETGVDKNGQLKRGPPDKAVSGSEVIFTNSFENVGNDTASDIVINNPIPADMAYKGDSAFGKDCMIVFSVDGGKKFGTAQNLKIKGADGKEHVALPRQYTHIRWVYQGQLAAGKFGEVGFRAVVK